MNARKLRAKHIERTTSRILSVLSVDVIDPEHPGKKKLLPVWQGEAFVALREVDELGLPSQTIRSLVKEGRLERYYFNGVKKKDSSRHGVYIKLSDLRNLFKK